MLRLKNCSNCSVMAGGTTIIGRIPFSADHNSACYAAQENEILRLLRIELAQGKERVYELCRSR